MSLSSFPLAVGKHFKQEGKRSSASESYIKVLGFPHGSVLLCITQSSVKVCLQAVTVDAIMHTYLHITGSHSNVFISLLLPIPKPPRESLKRGKRRTWQKGK